MAKRALILVDFQEEWADPNSPYFIGDIEEVIEGVNKLIDYCRKERYKIIFTSHVEPGSEESFRADSKNIEIIEGINKKSIDTLIQKNKINPFYQSKLENELSLVREIVVCGILSNLCVRSLIEDAYDREFDITVIKDCCLAYDMEVQDFTFDDLKNTRQEIDFKDLKDFIKTKDSA